MDKMIVTKGEAAVRKLVATTVASGLKYRVLQHQSAVSTVALAAETGHKEPLNIFFASLTKNDQTAFRLWLSRQHLLIGLNTDTVPDGLTTTETQAASVAGRVLSYSVSDGFSVVTTKAAADATIRRDRMVKRMDKAINEAPFYAIDNIATVQQFGNASLKAKIKAILREASKPSDKSFVNTVDKRAVERLTKFADGFVPFLEMLEIEAETPPKPKAETVQDKPKAKNKNKPVKEQDIPAVAG